MLSKDCRPFEETQSLSSLESSAAASRLNEAKGSCAAHKGMSGCRGADTQVSPRISGSAQSCSEPSGNDENFFSALIQKERENPELYGPN